MVMASMFKMKSNSFIINHDGAFITNSEGKRIMKDNFFNDLKTDEGQEARELTEKMENGVASEDMGKERYLVDGEECYLFYTPIKYTQWVLVTVVPCRAVDILSQLNAAVLLLIFILAMLLICLVVYYYIKNGIYPLKQLTKVARDIAAGKYNTPMPEMKHSDEICALRDAIEEMQFRLSNDSDNGGKH